MKRTVLSGIFAALLATSAQAADKPNLVSVVTAPDAQTQLMSMVLSMQAMQQGSKIHILLCGPAGDLALKQPPESATAPQKPMGMSPQGLMQKIMSAGGTVEVCAIYLPNKGAGQDALLDGILPAKPDAMASRLLADNTRLLTF